MLRTFIASGKRPVARSFSKLSVYDVSPGLVVFHEGRYLEILKAAPSTNKKLQSTYKVETLDLFANTVTKSYFSYSQIERFDVVDTLKLSVEYQYFDQERNLLIFSDEVYNQHEVPGYLYGGNVDSIQPGSRFVLILDGDRYIRIL